MANLSVPSELLAGTASVLITPPIGCQMAGFDARKGTATGVHDDLHARALVIDSGNNPIALVSVEVIGVTADFTRRVQHEASKRTGIPADHIVVAATHTHCGPVTFHHFFNQGQPLDDVYMDALANSIVESIKKHTLRGSHAAFAADSQKSTASR